MLADLQHHINAYDKAAQASQLISTGLYSTEHIQYRNYVKEMLA